VRIVGPNFFADLVVKDDIVVMADRPIRWMIGKPLARVVALAKRWRWRVEFNNAEREQGIDQHDRTQRPTA
jgi:hypothetical protein